MSGRNTRQRALVHDTLKELGGHNTAEEVFARLSALAAGISKSTVYRNLQRMAEDGDVRPVFGRDGVTRYDVTLGDHYHCQCLRCGRVIDAGLPYMAGLSAGAEGFTATGHTVTFYGVCGECGKG